MSRRTDKIYAVRGGLGHGVHDDWCDALDARYMQKQGHGNACSFHPDDRERANVWINCRKPLKETALTNWLDRQKFIVKLVAVAVAITLGAFGVFKIVAFAHEQIGCGKGQYFHDTHELCIQLSEFKTTLLKNQVFFWKAVFGEASALIVVAFAMALSSIR